MISASEKFLHTFLIQFESFSDFPSVCFYSLIIKVCADLNFSEVYGNRGLYRK